jgi:RNA 2',3'-cyclic 3'-phosphodiesterase
MLYDIPLEPQPEWRVFCAIDIPEHVKSFIADHAERLAHQFPDARVKLERSRKLHITLKFLGEIEVESLGELSRAAERAVADFRPFKVAVERKGVFPKVGKPRVLWLGITDETRQLARLQQALEDACVEAGFARQLRSFKPHLTIARILSSHRTQGLVAAHLNANFCPQGFKVGEILIMRSELLPSSSVYTTISRHLLRKY